MNHYDIPTRTLIEEKKNKPQDNTQKFCTIEIFIKVSVCVIGLLRRRRQSRQTNETIQLRPRYLRNIKHFPR